MEGNLCATCSVCHGLVPKQKGSRILALEGSVRSKVLVIDDATHQNEYEAACVVVARLLDPHDYDYTSTIRCNHDPDDMGPDSYNQVISSCAVWTHLLADGRSLILATKVALEQLKVGAKRTEGEAFRVGRLGVILCIPPLLEIEAHEEMTVYREKVKRVMREAGLA